MVFTFTILIFIIFPSLGQVSEKGDWSEAAPGEFQSLVLLKELETSIPHCSGAIVSFLSVVTAAECVADKRTKTLRFIGFVLAGTISQNNCYGSCQTRRIKDIIVHDGFFDGDDDNIGLIRLNSEFSETIKVRPSPIWYTTPDVQEKLRMVGFFSLEGGRIRKANVLHYTNVIVAPLKQCRISYGKEHFCINVRIAEPGAPVYIRQNLIGIVAFKTRQRVGGSTIINLHYYHKYIQDKFNLGTFMKLEARLKRKRLAELAGCARKVFQNSWQIQVWIFIAVCSVLS